VKYIALFVGSLALSVSSGAHAKASRPPVPPQPDTSIIRDLRIDPSHEGPNAQRESGRSVAGSEAPVLQSFQNEPPTVRDGRTDKQPAPKPPDTPIVRGSLAKPQTNSGLARQLVSGGKPTVPKQPDTPTARDFRLRAFGSEPMARTALGFSDPDSGGQQPVVRHPVPRPPGTPIIRDFRADASTCDGGAVQNSIVAVVKPPVPRPGDPPVITRLRPTIEG
jgi:hypothetical protein